MESVPKVECIELWRNSPCPQRSPISTENIQIVPLKIAKNRDPQYKSLINKEKSQDTPQDTPQDTLHVTEHVERLIALLTGEMNRSQLQEEMKLQDRSHFSSAYLGPALKAGLIEMTLPEKPKSRKQQYRRTARGEALAEQIKRKNAVK